MKIDSKLVKQLRTAKNWSQEQLSEVSGLSLRTIQRLENGNNASIESVRALAATYDIDPNDLIVSEQYDPTTPFDAVKMGLLQFANFSGTATRYEYWWFFLFVVLALAISTIIHEKAYQVVALILLIPLLAASTRRLNDAGLSKWWQMFFFIPFGQIVILYLLSYPNQSITKNSDTT